jgi:hypothetical protein
VRTGSNRKLGGIALPIRISLACSEDSGPDLRVTFPELPRFYFLPGTGNALSDRRDHTPNSTRKNPPHRSMAKPHFLPYFSTG